MDPNPYRYSPTEYAGFRITTFRPPTDEPCRQSCAARGRPRLSYRERHWIAPVRLAAAQSSPWLWPATYRPSRIDTTNHAEPPDKGPRKDPEKTNEFQNKQTNYSPAGRQSKRRGAKRETGPWGRLSKFSVLSHPSEDCYVSASQSKNLSQHQSKPSKSTNSRNQI